jgi:hypothetical protein
VEIFIGANDRRRRPISLRSPKALLLDAGTQVARRERIELGDGGRALDYVLLTKGRDVTRALFWRVGDARFCEEALRAYLALDQSPLRRPGRELVVRIATDQPVSGERAAQTLERFLQDFRGELEALDIPIGYAES